MVNNNNKNHQNSEENPENIKKFAYGNTHFISQSCIFSEAKKALISLTDSALGKYSNDLHIFGLLLIKLKSQCDKTVTIKQLV